MHTQQAATAPDSPFHLGEQHVQRRLGVRESIEPWARQVVKSYLPEEHRRFYTGLPFLVAAARDTSGRPWATLLTGRPGFIHAPDKRHLRIDATLPGGDALSGALVTGQDLGLLGIDLEARRRNRVNGRVTQGGASVHFAVEQAFGNCPQYIRERAWRWMDAVGGDTPVLRSRRLATPARRWIEGADTLFIASGYRGDGDGDAFGMDASHRGGPPGFVKVSSDTRLVWPDYAGNNHFNTIGNLVMDPGVGLLFVDFERGSLLQITGRASIDWDSEAVSEYPGAQRLVTVDIDETVELNGVLPLRWSAPKQSVRTLRVIEKVIESEDVVSFLLASRDGGPLPHFEAGQHLPLEVHLPGDTTPLRRTYSLSSGTRDRHYRISVKRQAHGIVSRHLHDRVTIGDLLNAAAPGGDFTLVRGNRPIALISAGIGVTPMISMLHELAEDPLRRLTWFIHGARDGNHHPLANEAKAVAQGHEHLHAHVRYSRPGKEDKAGDDYDSVGHVDANLLVTLLPTLDADFYLCGPTSFLADLSAQLRSRQVPAERIHIETFGPAA